MSKSLIKEASLTYDITVCRNTPQEEATVRAMLEAQPDAQLLLQMLGLEPYVRPTKPVQYFSRVCKYCGQMREIERHRWRCNDCQQQLRRERYERDKNKPVSRLQTTPTMCPKHNVLRVRVSNSWRCIECRKEAARARWAKQKEKKA